MAVALEQRRPQERRDRLARLPPGFLEALLEVAVVAAAVRGLGVGILCAGHRRR